MAPASPPSDLPPVSETLHANPKPARPASPADLFWSFTWLALQGFGGVLAIVQRELVEKKRWLTNEQFVEDWAVAQIMPGPNVCNLSIIVGDRYFGLRGAAAALAGMITLPLLLVLVLGVFYSQFADNAAVAGALRGMAAVAAGMVAGMGLKLAGALRKHPLGTVLGWVLAAVSFTAMALLRVPLYWVVFGLGGLACVLTWRKLSP